MRRTWATSLVCCALAFMAASARAERPDPRLFPTPPQLEANVDFWTDVYTKHSSSQVVIHDNWHLDVIYTVLDFETLENSKASYAHKRRARENAVRKAKHKYEGILDDLARGRRRSSNPADRREVEAKLAGIPGGSSKYRQARSRIRAQTGMKDKFEDGIERSGRYLPHIERIFRERQLPVELTRLPFVESMFNDKARSKVGAGGIWQFMPSTGRLYMRVNWEADERFDPILAAEAAARLLSDNYRSLETWPLALTAYNHGAGGMRRAVRVLGTRDIGVISERYKSRSFGFASRNFYSEFLAAAEIYENRQGYFPGATPRSPLRFDEFIPDRYVHFQSLARQAGFSVTELEDLNPALSDRVISGDLLIPKNYRIRVPPGSANQMARAYAALPSGYKLASQAAHERYHRVRPGDTLSTIARRYGSSTRTIQQANGLRSAHHIRIGQRLRVPVRGQFSAPKQPTRTKATAVATVGPGGTYVVRRGDNLSSIARAHGVTATELQKLNDIARVDLLRVGERLELPGGTSKHVVKAGETLSQIATRYGTTVTAIQRANGISRPDRIRPGQSLTVPGSPNPVVAARVERHVVRRGETLASISRRYGTTVQEIRSANSIRGSLIRPKQVLRIP